MTYPGNTSLSEEVRERIATTFDQTLDLTTAGRIEEAKTGCEFILQLDPQFGPARRLKERLQTAAGPVEIEDLRMTPAEDIPAATAPEQAVAPGDDIFELSPASGTFAAEGENAAAAPAAPPEETPPAPPPAEGALPAEFEPALAGTEEEFSEELESALDLSMLGAAPANAAPPPQETLTAETATPAQEPAPLAGSGAAEELPPLGEPSAALDAESESRIAELLEEGQAAFEQKRYQSAIDAWSRIFLVDIDHAEASRRIELARKLKSEVERQVEEVFHEAVRQVEGGDFGSARQGFERVLEMHPGHLSAKEYLEKLDSGGFAAPAKAPAPASEQPPTPDAPAAVGPAAPATAPDAAPEEFPAVPLSTPALEADIAVEAPTGPPPQIKPSRQPPARSGFRPSILYVGGAVLLLVAIGAWFLWSNWDSTFPNASDQTTRPTQPRIDPIARAVKVHEDGNTAIAIAQLKRLPPSHERYAEAQALIAQWEAPEETAQAPAATPEQLAQRDRLLQEARSAGDRGEFLLAHDLVTRAAASAPLEKDALELQATIDERLAPLASQIEIFRQGEWAVGLRSLWAMRQADPEDLDVQRLMVDSYYNLGVRDLQRQEPREAIEDLNEALELAGEDPEVERLLEFAETYENRPVDLLYRIFVKYVPFR